VRRVGWGEGVLQVDSYSHKHPHTKPKPAARSAPETARATPGPGPLIAATHVQELVKGVLGVLPRERQDAPVALLLQRRHL